MSRILIPVGDQIPSAATMEFAAYIARIMKSEVAGVLLKQPDTADENDLDIMTASSGIEVVDQHTPVAPSKRLHDLKARFINTCDRHDTVGYILADKEHSWDDLIKATRYADIVIVEGNLALETSLLQTNPTRYTKKLLHESECPVIVAPLTFHEIKDIVFAYDSSKSSMHAIRQFIYLFPEFYNHKLKIVSINQDRNGRNEINLLKGWASHYFADIECVELEGEPDDRLVSYLLTCHDSFQIMGGYGRNFMSRLIRPSTSAAVVKIVSSPIFIAHSS